MSQNDANLNANRLSLNNNFGSNQLYSNTEFIDPNEDLNNLNNLNDLNLGGSMPQQNLMFPGMDLNSMNPMMMPSPFSGNHMMPGLPPMNMGMPPMNNVGQMPMMSPFNSGMGFPNMNTNEAANNKNEETELEIAALKKKAEMLNRELDREISNSKIFEKKCEEYLNQLQRSADIIESLRSKYDNEYENYENRISTIQDVLKDQKEKNYDLEEENQRLTEELNKLRRDAELEREERFEMKHQIDENFRKAEYLEKDQHAQEDTIGGKQQVIVELKTHIDSLENQLKSKREDVNEMQEDMRKKELNLEKQYYEGDNLKKNQNELNNKIDDLYRDIDNIKQDKHHMGLKLNDKERENDDLKNEVFMLKKFIVDIERRDVELNNLKYKNNQNDDLKKSQLRDRREDRYERKNYRREERNEKEYDYNVRESVKSNNYGYNEHSPVRDNNFSSDQGTKQQYQNHDNNQNEQTYNKRGDDHFNIITWKQPQSPDREVKNDFNKPRERTPNRCSKHTRYPESKQHNTENYQSSPNTNQYDSQFTMDSRAKYEDMSESAYIQKREDAFVHNREHANEDHIKFGKYRNDPNEAQEMPVKKAGVRRYQDHTIYQESIPQVYSGVNDGPDKTEPGKVGSKFDQIPKRSAPTIKPSREKLESEITPKERQRKFYDDELLKLQVERDRIDNELSKIEASGKNNAYILREKRQLTSDQQIIQKKVSESKVKLRELK